MYVKIVCISFLLIFLQHVAKLIYMLGYHVTVYNHAPGPCHAVPGVEHGAEDMETLPNGMTFISTGFIWPLVSPHFAQLYNDQGRKGKILLFNFNTPDKGVTELGFDEDFDLDTFHPHGISVIQDQNTGRITLFVVNHTPDQERIEKFEFIEEKMMLKHKISYTDEAINLANDVAATSENSFYFTNFGYARSSFGFLIESVILQLPWGNVIYFDGGHYTEAAKGLLSPNGILLSKDKKHVYLASSLQKSLYVFKRETDDHLEILQEYQLHSGADNILIEPKSGNLVVGTQPVLHQMGAHMEAPDLHRGPSKVLIVHMKNSSYADGLTELYSDEGNNISGATVASIYDNKMLIGSVIDKLLYCEVRTL